MPVRAPSGCLHNIAQDFVSDWFDVTCVQYLRTLEHAGTFTAVDSLQPPLRHFKLPGQDCVVAMEVVFLFPYFKA